ncbi:MAG TPA: hypothetical protein VG758_21545 [Hyphomicrobiaceae bacterium]|jgi:hypothetical protein|nr:hypothetical protein [Hyphomicrobiaceae bacterium]
MWDILVPLAWVISAAIFLWLAWDFFAVNRSYSEEVLLSSREGIDELFPAGDQSAKKK